MEDITKEKLSKILEDVRKAHRLIFEYYKRIQSIIDYICQKISNGKPDVTYFPSPKYGSYWLFTRYFFGRDENRKRDDKKGDAFYILLVNNSALEEEAKDAKSELIFIFDEDDLFTNNEAKELKESDCRDIISEKKYENCSEEIQKIASNGHIFRINIEEITDKEKLEEKWQDFIKKLPEGCWLIGK